MTAAIKPSNSKVVKETELAELDKAKMLSSDEYASTKRSTFGARGEAKSIIILASTEKEREAFQTVLDDLLGRLSEK